MRLDNKITHAYTHCENLNENDITKIYKLSLKVIKSKPSTFKKNWLYMYNVSIKLHDTSTENVTPAATPRNYFSIFTRHNWFTKVFEVDDVIKFLLATPKQGPSAYLWIFYPINGIIPPVNASFMIQRLFHKI